MLKVKHNVKDVYECQINPDYLNNSLTNMRSKLTELEARKNNVQMTTAQKMKCIGKKQSTFSGKKKNNHKYLTGIKYASVEIY